MAILTHAIEPRTNILSARLGKVVATRFVGEVLAVENWRGPEPHWDSGCSADTGVQCTVFNGRTWRVICPDGLRNDFVREKGYTCEVDATTAVRVRAEVWSAWETWFAIIVRADRERAKALRAHNLPTEGKRVLIVKGRKVPRGTTWYVHRSGNGDYGPYVHLSSERNGMGEYVKYVNPQNVEVAEPFTFALDYWEGCPVATRDERILALVHEWNALPRGAYGRWDEVFKSEQGILLILNDLLLDNSLDYHAAIMADAGRAARPDDMERHW
jgi:hypothetical protein